MRQISYLVKCNFSVNFTVKWRWFRIESWVLDRLAVAHYGVVERFSLGNPIRSCHDINIVLPHTLEKGK